MYSRAGDAATGAGGAILISMTTGDWLDPEQQRAWLAYIRVQLRLSYEINRQLQADSDLSMPDYDVLTALGVSPGGRLPISALANQIGWERSRASHHVKRMAARGLVSAGQAATDRRVTEISLTADGRRVLDAAAPGHVALVKQLFFGGLPAHLVEPLTAAMENIYAHVLANGSLPPPEPR
jgi:DNA-binding MarR family transcriptional regulator